MSDEITPIGWKRTVLGDCCSLIRDGTHLPPSRVEHGPLLLGVQNMIAGRLRKTLSDTRVSWEFYTQMHRTWTLQPNDVLLAIVGATIGKVCTVPNDFPPFTLQRSVAVLRGDESSLKTEFLYWVISDAFFTRQIWQRANQTAQPGLYLGEIQQLRVLLPSTSEQRKIARILTTLDNLIEKTESLIAKYQAVKQGMMHDLFTRGVDAHGKLRPTQSEAPDLYKQSELGWIPMEWDVARLGDEIGPIVSGWSPNCDGIEADLDEWAILKTTAVVWDGYSETENKRLPDGLEPIADLEVQRDDILITRKGPMLRVGVVVHVPATRTRLMIPDTVFRLRLLPKRSLLPAFVPLTLASEVVQRDWFGRKIGLADAQVDINHRILKGTSFPKPCESEQQIIIERSRSISRKLQSFQTELQKYQHLKSGLMQDLLTGRVRVKVDEEEAANV